MRDFYVILGVKRNAGAEEIKAAWRRQAKSAHPDQNPDDPLAHNRFAEIGQAYDILKDPAKRRRYDQQRIKLDGLERDNTIMAQREAAKAAAERAKQAKERAERVMEELARAEAEKLKADAAVTEAAQAVHAARAAKAAAAKAAADQAAAATAPGAASENSGKTVDEGRDGTERTKAGASDQQAGKTEPHRGNARAESPEEMVSRIFGEGPEAEAAAESLRREREAASKAGVGSILSPLELFTSLVRIFRGPAPPLPEKAPDVFAEAVVAIDDLLQQRHVPLTLNDGREVRVPLRGVTDGHVVRLREQGLRLPGMQRGDVAVTIRVQRSERFIVDGLDIRTVLPITLENAVLGCELDVEGPEGKVAITVPAWSNSEQVLRIEELGLPNGEGGRGAFVVELRVMLWDKPDEKVTDLMRLMREGLYV